MALKRETLQQTIDAVTACGGNRRLAAELLGLHELSVYKRLRRARALGMAVPSGTRRGRPPLARDQSGAVCDENHGSGDKSGPLVNKRGPIRDNPPAAPIAEHLVQTRVPAHEGRTSYYAADQASRRELWRQYVAGGRRDVTLRNYLLELELPTLRRMVDRLASTLPSSVDPDDLFQEAYRGLHDCASRYDPDRFGFWTFAARRVTGAMLDGIRAWDRVPRLVRGRASRRLRFVERFDVEHGRPPTDEEIMLALGWSRAEYGDSFPAADESLERSINSASNGDDKLIALRDLLAACEAGPDAATLSEDYFLDVTCGLSFEDRSILWLYFFRDATMVNIGRVMSLSESRVSQMMSAIKQRLLERLRVERECA